MPGSANENLLVWRYLRYGMHGHGYAPTNSRWTRYALRSHGLRIAVPLDAASYATCLAYVFCGSIDNYARQNKHLKYET